MSTERRADDDVVVKCLMALDGSIVYKAVKAKLRDNQHDCRPINRSKVLEAREAKYATVIYPVQKDERKGGGWAGRQK